MYTVFMRGRACGNCRLRLNPSENIARFDDRIKFNVEFVENIKYRFIIIVDNTCWPEPLAADTHRYITLTPGVAHDIHSDEYAWQYW